MTSSGDRKGSEDGARTETFFFAKPDGLKAYLRIASANDGKVRYEFGVPAAEHRASLDAKDVQAKDGGLEFIAPWPASWGCRASRMVLLPNTRDPEFLFELAHDVGTVAHTFRRLRYPVCPESAVLLGPNCRSGRQHLRSNGFCILRKAVPSSALLRFMAGISKQMSGGGKDGGWTSRELQSDLLRVSGAAAFLCELLGLRQDQLPTTAQLAAKYPCGDPLNLSPEMCDPTTIPRGDEHIDGMPTTTNGVPNGRVLNFALLVGFALDDTGARPGGGNLGVLPGSHFALAQAFRAYTASVQRESKNEDPVNAFLGEKTNGSPSERLRAVLKRTGTSWKQFLEAHPPQPVLLRTGDAVIAHFQTVHFVYHNTSLTSRKMLYFRIMPPNRIDWKNNNPKALVEPFAEFVGMS